MLHGPETKTIPNLLEQSSWLITDASKNVDDWNQEI